MRKLPAGVLLASLLVLGLVQAPATADSWRFPDKGSGGGPLSIAAIHGGHARSGPTVTVVMDKPLNPGAMDVRDFVVVDVEADGKGRSEAWVYFFGVRGKLRSYLYYPKADYGYEDGIRFSRPDARTIKFTIPGSWVEDGVYFAAGAYSKTGCAKPCWDAAPNGGYVIHDWTPPKNVVFSAPEWTFGGPAEVVWRSTDTGFSRIRGTTLMAGVAGSGKWRRITTRRKPAKQTAKVPLKPGSHTMFQIVSEDGARNRSLSRVLTTRVPFDQTRDGGTAYAGAWVESEVEGSFGGTVHTSTTPLDSFTFAGKGNSYCLVYDWETDAGSATFDVGGVTKQMTHDPNTPLPAMPDCFDFADVADRTATLTVTAGRLSLDGFWSGRIGAWTKTGAPRGYSTVMPRSTKTRPASLARLLDAARVRR